MGGVHRKVIYILPRSARLCRLECIFSVPALFVAQCIYHYFIYLQSQFSHFLKERLETIS